MHAIERSRRDSHVALGADRHGSSALTRTHSSPHRRRVRIRALSLLVAALVASIAACGGEPDRPDTSFGLPCDDASQCLADAPTCVALDVAGYAPGLCASACDDGACPAGSECRADACIRCAPDRAATVAAGGDCACNADCTSGACELGVCIADCTLEPCAEGFSCDGAPPSCRACLGGDRREEGLACSCDADCAAGLGCIGDFCGRPCAIDEMCGADECQHDLAVPPSCFAVSPECSFGSDGLEGQACSCNADCSASAPLCVYAFVEGERRGACSSTCGAEMPCGADTRCCYVEGGSPYCVEEENVAPLGATCL